MFRYEYTGDTPVVFPDLTGVRKAQGLPGEVEPGETIETPEPLLSGLLVPADAHTAQATLALAEADDDPTPPDPPRGRRAKAKADESAVPTPTDPPADVTAGQED